jgi:hypothetical protein
LQAWAGEHLIYELGMLRDVSIKLGNRHHADDGVVENALLESFTLHARVLLDFFYGNRRKADDALASDFFADDTWERQRPDRSTALEEVNQRVGKEVAHLTYARADIPSDAKGWPIIPMYLELASVFSRFVRLVPEEIIGRDFLEVAIPILPTAEPVRHLDGMPVPTRSAPKIVEVADLTPQHLSAALLATGTLTGTPVSDSA